MADSTPPPERSDALLLKAIGALRATPPAGELDDAQPISLETFRALRSAPAGAPRDEEHAELEDDDRLLLKAIGALRAAPTPTPTPTASPPQRHAPRHVVTKALLLAAGLLLALAAGWGLTRAPLQPPAEGLTEQVAPGPAPDAEPVAPRLFPAEPIADAPSLEAPRAPTPVPERPGAVTPKTVTPKTTPSEAAPSEAAPSEAWPAPEPGHDAATPTEDEAPTLALVDEPQPSTGYRERGGAGVTVYAMALYTPGGPTPTRVMEQPLSVGAVVHFYASAKRSGDARLTVIHPDGRHDVLTVKVTGQPEYLSDELGRALQFVFPQAGLYRVHLTTDGRCGEGCAQQEVTIQ